MKKPPKVTHENIYDVRTHAPGPTGRLPLQPEFLREAPSGDIFGWTQDAAMGWNPDELGKKEFLILSTQGSMRATDGSPIAAFVQTAIGMCPNRNWSLLSIVSMR